MFDCKYKVYINGLWFDALYGADYYDDKRMFYASGAKQFFTIYQILKTGDYVFTLVAEKSGQRTEIVDSEDFKVWVKENYGNYLNCLDDLGWAQHPESDLQQNKNGRQTVSDSIES